MITRLPDNLSSHRVAADMRRQQEAIETAREQLASGRRVNRPSDDPARAAQLVRIDDARGRLEQFDRNASAAESRLALEESALAAATDTLARVRELALSANGGTLGERDRETLRGEVMARLEELYDTANARDAGGDYLFAGSRSDTRPFERAGGAMSFHGDDVARELMVGPSSRVASGGSGIDAFVRIPTGNGDFAVAGDAANTGTGVVATGSVTDRTAFRGVDYRIEFTSPTSFDVVDAGSGTTVLAGAAFTDGDAIAFEGLTTSITGAPAAGDVFTIESGERRDVFDTVARLGELLASPGSTPEEKTRLDQGLSAALVDLDRAMDAVSSARGQVGTRLQIVESSRQENENVGLELTRTASDIEDVDVADAVMRLESRAFALEVLQKSWSRVENLSLFNYL